MMRLIKNSNLFGDFRPELEGDEAELISFYGAAFAFDYAFALSAVNARELLVELRQARRLGLSREDYWNGPALKGALH